METPLKTLTYKKFSNKLTRKEIPVIYLPHNKTTTATIHNKRQAVIFHTFLEFSSPLIELEDKKYFDVTLEI